MRKIKLFPAPHLEIKITVTDQMVKDLHECHKRSSMSDFDYESGYCDNCSWNKVEFLNVCMCELDDVLRLLLGGQNDGR